MTRSIPDIIAACGGREAISEMSRAIDPSDYVRPHTIYDWHQAGIPEKRWPALLALSEEVTEAELHAANEALRQSKKNSEDSVDRRVDAVIRQGLVAKRQRTRHQTATR